MAPGSPLRCSFSRPGGVGLLDAAGHRTLPARH